MICDRPKHGKRTHRSELAGPHSSPSVFERVRRIEPLQLEVHHSAAVYAARCEVGCMRPPTLVCRRAGTGAAVRAPPKGSSTSGVQPSPSEIGFLHGSGNAAAAADSQ